LSTNGSGDGTSTDVNATGSGVSVLELYRPTPNPFSNTTSFAYQVSGSASERVQIGIYNVAGRLIRELVNETKAPGRYETVWNGQDQGGSSVTHGVYFIRARVGGTVVESTRVLLVP
ncbi:MAG TPA: FlgD immunoglobulin-like domain containing protein, partial [Candidatus Eisenbacteria bacterium]|nr:FlgD immunoglobulin-like domain containing protein [Candidatus Eisenbacteria bacterium]